MVGGGGVFLEDGREHIKRSYEMADVTCPFTVSLQQEISGQTIFSDITYPTCDV